MILFGKGCFHGSAFLQAISRLVRVRSSDKYAQLVRDGEPPDSSEVVVSVLPLVVLCP